MNSEAEKVNARPEEIKRILAGKCTTSDWYNAFIWRASPQGSSHWVDVMDGVKPLSEADRKYLESLLKEEEKMASFVEKTPRIKEGWHLGNKVWLERDVDDDVICLYTGDGDAEVDFQYFSKQELRQLIDGLTEVYEVLED